MYILRSQPNRPPLTVTTRDRAASASDSTGVLIAIPHLRPGDTIPALFEPS